LSSSPSAEPLAGERPAEVANRLKSIFAGSVGNLIEWYDSRLCPFWVSWVRHDRDHGA